MTLIICQKNANYEILYFFYFTFQVFEPLLTWTHLGLPGQRVERDTSSRDTQVKRQSQASKSRQVCTSVCAEFMQ